MSRFQSNSVPRRLGLAGLATLVVALPFTVRAQSNQPRGEVPGAAATSTDVYGNPQFGLPERRPLGIFHFDAAGGQRAGGILNRTRDQRGGDTLFSLPGDLLGLSTMATLANTVSPGVSATVPERKAEAFYRYGGFGTRYVDQFQDPVSTAFARRFELMHATSQAAPVYRALAENRSMAGIRSAIVKTPFARPDDSPLLDSPISLFQRLDARAATLYTRASDEAWALFLDGSYRLASRAFLSVLVLSPEDLSARVGEIFCHVNTGAIRTAMAIVADLDRHSDNVFSADLDMAARFAETASADRLGTDARLALESVAEERSADLDATYIIVLWYLGKREDAARSAVVLSRRAGARNYADWPAKMRDAEQGSGGVE